MKKKAILLYFKKYIFLKNNFYYNTKQAQIYLQYVVDN